MSMSKSVSGGDLVCGKRYAGELRDAEPFFGFGYTKDVRCIYGSLGRDHKNRGFDGGPVRTSVVEKLTLQDGDIYAITMNSAYKLESIQLQHFLASNIWRDDISKLLFMSMTGVVLTNEEPKID